MLGYEEEILILDDVAAQIGHFIKLVEISTDFHGMRRSALELTIHQQQKGIYLSPS